MKICSICHKISATGEDHLDCIQKRKVELGDDDFKQKLTEKLDMAKNAEDLRPEIRALLDYMTKEKTSEVSADEADNIMLILGIGGAVTVAAIAIAFSKRAMTS